MLPRPEDPTSVRLTISEFRSLREVDSYYSQAKVNAHSYSFEWWRDGDFFPIRVPRFKGDGTPIDCWTLSSRSGHCVKAYTPEGYESHVVNKHLIK